MQSSRRTTASRVAAACVVATGPMSFSAHPDGPIGLRAAPVSSVAPMAPVVTTAASALTIAGRWTLNDTSGQQSDLPDRNLVAGSNANQNGDFPGYRRSTTTVKENQGPLYPDSGHSYYFPGWHDLTTGPCPGAASSTCDFVVADASLAHIPDPLGAFSPGVVPRTGGHSPHWTVDLDVQSDPITVETSDPFWDKASGPFGSASPNIIQQGKAHAAGQWKVSQHPRKGDAQHYSISCDFQDRHNVARTARMARSSVLNTGSRYHIQCALLPGGIPRLVVSQLGIPTRVVDVTATAYAPMQYEVIPPDDVYFGKKFSRNGGTGSLDHANDAFAGFIDNIVISTTR